MYLINISGIKNTFWSASFVSTGHKNALCHLSHNLVVFCLIYFLSTHLPKSVDMIKSNFIIPDSFQLINKSNG